jgi:hypothetical protein
MTGWIVAGVACIAVLGSAVALFRLLLLASETDSDEFDDSETSDWDQADTAGFASSR